jgi:hypothetical protein
VNAGQANLHLQYQLFIFNSTRGLIDKASVYFCVAGRAVLVFIFGGGKS